MKVNVGEICKRLEIQRDRALRIVGRGRLTSHSNQSLFECMESFTKEELKVDMSLYRFRRQYEQLSQFNKERILGIMEAGWTARRVALQLGRSDFVVRRCWD
ncbi:hypothetical protein TNCV_4713191 [Trichonephila clavipes]|nr:hypothetical protein TNCV_4713191 [Trichonephila clavipes]